MDYSRWSVYDLKEEVLRHWDDLGVLQQAHAALLARKTQLGLQLYEFVTAQIAFLARRPRSESSEASLDVRVHHCTACHKPLRVQLVRAFTQGFSCPRCGTRHIGQIKREEERCPYRILGIEEDASSAEILRAYRRRMQEYHVDRLQGMAPDLYALAEEALKQINLAFEKLRDNRGR